MEASLWSGRMRSTKKRVCEKRTAWGRAQAYGVDMSLLEANLRKTPQERIRAHSRALSEALALEKALAKKRHGKS